MWAGIMFDGRTDLHIFGMGSVTALRCKDKMLEPYICLYRGALGPGFIFCDENAHPHQHAAIIDDFLETEDIQRMHWHPVSPDLNSIEHV